MSQNNRFAKLLKKPKEKKEDDRPPWRAAVGVAPVKDDAHAILRARLLDASRRLARAARNPSVGVQTDKQPTKLFKEISVGPQRDLIPMRDKGCLTDGTITIQDKHGNFILTHSVSQMTDAIGSAEIETQTALPRSNVSFHKYITSGDGALGGVNGENSNSSTNISFNKIKQNEFRLLRQADEIRKIDELLKQNERKKCEQQGGNADLNQNDDEQSMDADSISDGDTTSIPKLRQFNKLSQPTQNYWHDIDFSSDDETIPQLPRTTVSGGGHTTAWNDFKDMLMGQRLSKMRLSPIPPRKFRPNMKHVTWSDTQQRVISELVTEASALMDIFDQVSLLLGPNIHLNETPVVDESQLPPFHMDVLLKNSCDLLEAKINKIKPIKLLETEKLNPDWLEYTKEFNRYHQTY